jgi:hypothetical protein
MKGQYQNENSRAINVDKLGRDKLKILYKK